MNLLRATPDALGLSTIEAELERERAGARKLREALELAATYFDAPAGDREAERAWERICEAIRSPHGRAAGDTEEASMRDWEPLAA